MLTSGEKMVKTVNPKEGAVRSVDVKEAQTKLLSQPYEKVADQLYSFGALLLGEVQQRTTALDAKLTSVLGWTAAMLAFLLIGNQSWVAAPMDSLARLQNWLMIFAAVLAIGAIFCAFLGMKTTLWIWPSQRDWFKMSLFDQGLTLKKFHIIAMLEAHQAHNHLNQDKGKWAWHSQWLLAVAATSVGLSAFVKLFAVLSR